MSATTTHAPVVLEPAAQAVRRGDRQPAVPLRADARRGARRCSTTCRPRRSTSCRSTSAGITVPCDFGDVRVRILRPAGVDGTAARDPVHARRRLGPRQRRHARPARPRAGRRRRRASLVFVEYDRSPEARYPVAIEQGYAAARWIVREGAAHGLDAGRMAIAGDSVGGCMTAAIALMAQRARRRALRAPVDVLPGHRRRDGHRVLRAVRRGLLPLGQGDGVVLGLLRAGSRAQRAEPFASPLRASDAQLAGLPPALVDRRRGRRAARRGRGVRGPPAGGGRRRSRPCATTARSTTS